MLINFYDCIVFFLYLNFCKGVFYLEVVCCIFWVVVLIISVSDYVGYLCIEFEYGIVRVGDFYLMLVYNNWFNFFLCSNVL